LADRQPKLEKRKASLSASAIYLQLRSWDATQGVHQVKNGAWTWLQTFGTDSQLLNWLQRCYQQAQQPEHRTRSAHLFAADVRAACGLSSRLDELQVYTIAVLRRFGCVLPR
jgi:hypothetical protein